MNSLPRRAMNPDDLTRIRFVTDPRISPDGKRVAFVVTTLSADKDEYLSNIWIANVDDGHLRRFTTGPTRDTHPRWSPDGTRLAFLSDRGPCKKAHVYVMPATGGEPTCLTDLKRGVSDPVWSPDGTRLAFVSRVGGWDEPDDEEEKAKSKPPRVIRALKHKLNGEGFTYDRRPHIFVVAADGGELRQITDGDFADAEPTWSPDGRSIAFVSSRHETRDEDNVADIWIVAADGGELRRVTHSDGPVASPSFSPDGRLLAYVGHRFRGEVGRHERVYTVSVDGGTVACLTEALDRGCENPTWTAGSDPSAQAITFTCEDSGNVSIYRVPTSGGKPEPITTDERQVLGYSVSADGKTIAFTATDPVAPAEVFVCNIDGTNERQLTDLNREWTNEVALSRPERHRFDRDGFTLDYWVMNPFGFEPDQRYPTLLVVHGGPMSQYGTNFFDEFQVYAAAGYVVVFTNPRGSSGRGEAFSRAVVGDWGGGDYRDVIAALDEAIKACDFIDPERLGIMGGSYGGFMTSWTIGHLERFKAACSERAVNDLRSFFGTSDIGPFFGEAYTDGLPWETPSWYVEHSPLTYAKNITTPLLIIHSENDLRCPIEQAEQLFATLKRQRKDVLFIRFPDETHELSRSGKPRHRIERFRIILDWFATYLGGQRGGSEALQQAPPRQSVIM